ncbi:hypothetical protein [Mycetocola spongiae]|uniref:hypothetical protein n=1 Tax=Mycetocola spongiae TaxID=2859226 RepID=UPI001CF51E85|nr:hypothetical protein [Mycetocola spongiae]UCR88517.1 hypothetical protein KXZ72_11185 [Mycetocola spongiae]
MSADPNAVLAAYATVFATILVALSIGQAARTARTALGGWLHLISRYFGFMCCAFGLVYIFQTWVGGTGEAVVSPVLWPTLIGALVSLGGIFYAHFAAEYDELVRGRNYWFPWRTARSEAAESPAEDTPGA